ncbi:MAG: hypothetical protein ACOX69_07845 [Coriobacteriales bacterium]|jgi:hypothetical protein
MLLLMLLESASELLASSLLLADTASELLSALSESESEVEAAAVLALDSSSELLSALLAELLSELLAILLAELLAALLSELLVASTLSAESELEDVSSRATELLPSCAAMA